MALDKSELDAAVPGSVPGSDTELGTRIERVADLYDGRKSAALAAGISTDSLQRYIRGEVKPTMEAMRGLCVPKGVSLDWLATGEGFMRPALEAGPGAVRKMQVLGILPPATRLTSGPDDSTALPLRVDIGEDVPRSLPLGFVLVPRYDVKAAAGRGAINESEDLIEHYAYKEAWLRQELKVDPARLCIIDVVGASMEPDIYEGEELLVDRSITRFIGDGVYLVRFEGGLLVKQLQRAPGGILRLVSRNGRYETQTVNERSNQFGTDFAILGRVLGKPGFTKL